MHPLINPNSNYEPSSSSKNRWLYTRKNKINYPNIQLPGLFETYNFKVDSYLFVFMIALEAYGVYVLWAILPTPMFAFVGLAMDVFCAIFAHLMRKHICLARNIKVLAENGVSFSEEYSLKYTIQRQKSIIFRNRVYEFFFYGLILLLALGKILTIYSFASSSAIVPGLKMLIAMIYIATAYIHINHTGYFVFEIWFRYFIKRERRKVEFSNPDRFIQNNVNDGILYRRNYKLKNTYKDATINKMDINKSQLIKTDNGISYFSCWGILQDSELKNLVDLQDEEKQKALAIELLCCQLNMKQSEATRGTETLQAENTKL